MRTKTEDFVLFSNFDNTRIRIPVKSEKTHWNSRKCWNARCSNFIDVVHMTEKGNFTHGYCLSCYENAMFHIFFLFGYSHRGKWMICRKGKLEEDSLKKKILERVKAFQEKKE